MKFEVLDRTFAVVKLSPSETTPDWAAKGNFCSISKTPDELSIVCDQENVPPDVKSESGWRCLKVIGPLDFNLTGVLASIASPLAESKISIFAISTFDTDYVMVKQDNLNRAVECLIRADHEVRTN